MSDYACKVGQADSFSSYMFQEKPFSIRPYSYRAVYIVSHHHPLIFPWSFVLLWVLSKLLLYKSLFKLLQRTKLHTYCKLEILAHVFSSKHCKLLPHDNDYHHDCLYHYQAHQCCNYIPWYGNKHQRFCHRCKTSAIFLRG